MSLLPDSTPSTKGLLWGLAGEVIRKAPLGKNNDKDKGQMPQDVDETILLLLVFTLVFSIATAPCKILMRKNFGPKAISIWEVLAGAFILLGSGLRILFYNWDNPRWTSEPLNGIFSFYRMLYIISPYVLFALGLIVLIKGIIENYKAQLIETDDWAENNYRGDSLLFRKRVKSDKSRYKVWRQFEPNFCIIISILSWHFFYIIAIPLICLSVAFKVNEYFHVKFKWEKLHHPRPTPKNTVSRAH